MTNLSDLLKNNINSSSKKIVFFSLFFSFKDLKSIDSIQISILKKKKKVKETS